MNDLPTPVAREVVAFADEELVDLTVEVAHRKHLGRSLEGHCEPEDKKLVRLRGDWRNSASKPTIASMESGRARQLAAALLRAADIAEDLDANAV